MKTYTNETLVNAIIDLTDGNFRTIREIIDELGVSEYDAKVIRDRIDAVKTKKSKFSNSVLFSLLSEIIDGNFKSPFDIIDETGVSEDRANELFEMITDIKSSY